jgi:hypothetical protein
MDGLRDLWWRGKGKLIALGIALVFALGTASSFYGQMGQSVDQQASTDQQITEQTVYDYINNQLQISPSLKGNVQICARLVLTKTQPYNRRRVEPSLFLSFLTILNTDSRLGLVEKTAIMQKFVGAFCEVSVLWRFSTVYEFLGAPSVDLEKLTTLIEARRKAQSEVMGVLQKAGIFVNAPVAGAPAPGLVDALLVDIPSTQISVGLELYVLGVSMGASAKDAAKLAVQTNSAIPAPRPNSPAGPQLDAAWLPIMVSKVDAIDVSEWNRVAQTICQNLKQLGQPVAKC